MALKLIMLNKKRTKLSMLQMQLKETKQPYWLGPSCVNFTIFKTPLLWQIYIVVVERNVCNNFSFLAIPMQVWKCLKDLVGRVTIIQSVKNTIWVWGQEARTGAYLYLLQISSFWCTFISASTYGPMSPGCTSGGQICPSNEIVKQIL